MSNYIVCWNDDILPKQLKPSHGENDITVYTNQRDFMAKKSKTLLKKADGFIVLCELAWDHETESAALSEFRGVRLVQQYIRKELGVKAPVVFASFLSPTQLVKFKKETNIVQTPALQHNFVQLPCENPLREIKNANFTNNAMREQSDRDLAYTRMFYCDLKGLLRGLHHVLVDIQEETKDEYRTKYKDQIIQLKYVIEQEFPAEKDKLLEELHERNDLHTFSQFLLDKLNFENNTQVAEKYKKYKGLKILYLEDEPEKENVKRFVEYCENIPDSAKNLRDAEVNKKFFFKLISDVDKIPSVLDVNANSFCGNYDVVISDIELRNKEGMLKYLGYDLIEQMAAKTRNPLYYIVTNMSRSVYDQVKPSIVKRIMLKSEAFGSDELIENFLYGIREALGDRKKYNDKTDTQSIFNYFEDYIKTPKKESVSIHVEFKNVKEEKVEKNLTLPEGVFDFVDKQAKVLVKYFNEELILKELKHKRGKKQGCDFITFNKCCKSSREKISDTMRLGSKDWKRYLDMTKDPSADDLVRFVKILILRRYFLYVKEFVKSNNIMASLNDYRERVLCYCDGDEGSKERNNGITEYDLAFRAIATQYKTLNIEGYEMTDDDFLFGDSGTEVTTEGGWRKQSRTDATLLWNTRVGKWTEEEGEFEKWSKNNVCKV